MSMIEPLVVDMCPFVVDLFKYEVNVPFVVYMFRLALIVLLGDGTQRARAAPTCAPSWSGSCWRGAPKAQRPCANARRACAALPLLPGTARTRPAPHKRHSSVAGDVVES